MMNDKAYSGAISANIAVHSAMANEYNEKEPHFRKESIDRVKGILKEIKGQHSMNEALDLGCGTGFMINLLKEHSSRIVGVDVTQAMLDRVDVSGGQDISLINSDTAKIDLPDSSFDICTAYTFLDHLYDMVPTFRNCHRMLKEGGVFYADLSPNAYFWDEIKALPKHLDYDGVVQREIDAVTKKDLEVEQEFGVDRELFVKAEYQKHIEGGLREELVEAQLKGVGFSEVRFVYHWFIGQAQMINEEGSNREDRLQMADMMHTYLNRSLPISRSLFKYVGFIAIK